MLVLGVREHGRIIIEDTLTGALIPIEVTEFPGNSPGTRQVKLGITLPKRFVVDREKIFLLRRGLSAVELEK